MATGRLGASDVPATTLTTVYTCPASVYTIASINICNRGATAADIRIAVATTDTPGAAEYIEYDLTIAVSGVLERTGIVLATGQRLVVYSSAASISAVVYGIESTA